MSTRQYTNTKEKYPPLLHKVLIPNAIIMPSRHSQSVGYRVSSCRVKASGISMSESPINGSSSSQRVPSEASSYILFLNYDCLERIFSLLSLEDQLSFSRSNREIERIYRNYVQWKYKHITEDITDSLEGSDLEYLMEQVNEDLISYKSYVYASSRAEEELRLLRMHCPMLRHLKMTFSRPYWEDLIQLKNLNTLDVSFLELSSTNDYEKFFFNLSENLPCLRKLVLEAPDYNGKGLHVLEKLQHLEISYFCDLDAKYIIECCIRMKNLHFLKIGMNTINLSNENLSAIVANCRNLETLGFTDNELLDNVAYERVCELPRLKHLIISFPRLGPCFIEGLVRRTGTPLESLILYNSYLCKEHIEHICDISSLRELGLSSWNDNFNVEDFTKLKSLEYLHLEIRGITNKQLLELLLGCPRLRVLHVLNCWNINSDFISLLNRSAKKLKEINRGKISIYLGDSSVDWEGNSSFKIENIHIKKGHLKSPIFIIKELKIQ